MVPKILLPSRKTLLDFSESLPSPRIIQDGLGRTKYLSRWYLFDKDRPTMVDGSDPFDGFGNPKVGVMWKDNAWGTYLHRFHRSDVDRELHSHPWDWAVSLILVGGYIEERRIGSLVVKRLVAPGDVNFLTKDDFHRVDLIEEDAWSLFIVGRKSTTWGFWDRTTDKVTPWREFLAAKQT